jgi:hypothetical protein
VLRDGGLLQKKLKIKSVIMPERGGRRGKPLTMGDVRTHKQQCCMDVPYSTLASGGDSSPKEKKQNKSNLLSTHALAHHKNQIGGLGYLPENNPGTARLPF